MDMLFDRLSFLAHAIYTTRAIGDNMDSFAALWLWR